MAKQGFFARLSSLIRGLFGARLSRAEVEHADAVYHSAIAAQQEQHGRLKQAAARLLYLRNQSEGQRVELERDLALVARATNAAVDAGDDARALTLLAERRRLEERLERVREEHGRLERQAEDAKRGLGELIDAIAHLKAERQEMLARKEHAVARREARAALSALTDPSRQSETLAALDNVRQAIVELETMADLESEGEGREASSLIASLRADADATADHDALAALKRERQGRLLTTPQGQVIDAEGRIELVHVA